jgi:CheY-like chemotaxis protein
MLAISDTGQGIEPERIDKVFEPFFTDKPIGMGSGLGLSMVQGFIKQSGGAIRIYSEVGVGTTFKLYFKAVEHAVDVESDHDQSPRTCVDSECRILLAEDEKEVMRILMLMLEDAGYNTTTASSGDLALNAFKDGGKFDLLITDVVMPGRLQGPGLARAIREIQPEIPCIFLSGYAAEATVHGNGLKPSDIRRCSDGLDSGIRSRR